MFPVPWSSSCSWSLHLFLGRPTFLRPFGLYCSACFGSLFVSILCMCCSHTKYDKKTNSKPFKSYWHLIQNSTISTWVKTRDSKPWNLLRGSVRSRNYHGQRPPTALPVVQRATIFTPKNWTEMVHLIFKGLITCDKITPLWSIHQGSTSENDCAPVSVPELPNTVSSG